MNEIILRRIIREYIVKENQKPIQEGLLTMIMAYKAAKWLMSDTMGEVEDSYGDLQSTATALQDSVQNAIEGIEDRVIKETIISSAEGAVEELQSSINSQRQTLVDKITQEIEGSEDLKEKMDEEDVNAMVSLAMSATLAKVIVTLSSE